MHIAVVYESLFGNKREIVAAMSDGIRAARPEAEVVCLPVTEASTDLAQLDLLVVGGPTHFLGTTSERTRANAGSTRPQRRPAGTRRRCAGAGRRG